MRQASKLACLNRRAATHTAFDNDEAVEREYYSESIALVKELTGASRVVVFDHSESSDLRSLRPRSYLTPPAAIRRRRPGDPEDKDERLRRHKVVHGRCLVGRRMGI